MLEAGSVLTVVCGANGNSVNDVLKTRFSVILLHKTDDDDDDEDIDSDE